MNQSPEKKNKNRTSSGWVLAVPTLFILLVISATYFSRGALLNRADRVIDLKVKAIRDFVEQPSFAKGLVQEAEQNQEISDAEKMRLDKEWIKHPEESAILAKLRVNDLSRKLNQFSAEHPAFKEIFLTDMRGFVVALTNPTSDYYQADEGWWKRIFQEGGYIGDIEYDESSNSTFYGIYEPVKDNNGTVIGILKGVLDAYDVRVIGNQLEDL